MISSRNSVTLLQYKSVTMNLQCYAISFSAYCVIACCAYTASSIVNFVRVQLLNIAMPKAIIKL